MNQPKLRDVDIFQRTLCCQQALEKGEEEIEAVEKTEETWELEVEEEDFEEDTIDLKLLLSDLECMKRKIQNIQLKLKMKINECPKEKCMDYDVLLSCSQNKEICDLQKKQHMLQCQIKELIECFKVAKDEVLALQEQMCQKNKIISELKEENAHLMEWKNNLDHEFGKCLERFEYLKHVKAEWSDVIDKMEEQRSCFSSFKKSLISKECFKQEKKSFMSTIGEFRQLLNELLQYQFERFASLEKRLQDSTIASV